MIAELTHVEYAGSTLTGAVVAEAAGWWYVHTGRSIICKAKPGYHTNAFGDPDYWRMSLHQPGYRSSVTLTPYGELLEAKRVSDVWEL